MMFHLFLVEYMVMVFGLSSKVDLRLSLGEGEVARER